MLRAETGAVAVHRLCPRCGSGEHGRPFVTMASGRAPAVSISYTDHLVAVAWSWTGPVGIDIERAGRPVDGTERWSWTQQEAVFKAGPGDHPVTAVTAPGGYLGSVAGAGVSWRLAGPAALPG